MNKVTPFRRWLWAILAVVLLCGCGKVTQEETLPTESLCPTEQTEQWEDGELPLVTIPQQTEPAETTEIPGETKPPETTKPNQGTIPPETTVPAEATKPAETETVPPATTVPSEPPETVPPITTVPSEPPETVPPETTVPTEPPLEEDELPPVVVG